MKTPLPPYSQSYLRQKTAHHLRYLLLTCLMVGGLLFAASAIEAALNHPPFVSWIPDQAIVDASSDRPGFDPQYFRMQDYDGDSAKQ
jgi:hypothetical protein